MAGILDYLTGNDQAASPMGALYQSPLTDDDAKRQKAAADLLASMGLSPTNAAPAPSPFGDPTQFSVANAANPTAPQSGFGAGAVPFSFAGPGSMPGAGPGMTSPTPAPQPAPPAAPVAPAAAPPVVADDQADPLKVGSYSMPRIGSADSFEPDDSTPANAAPVQGQLPAAPGAPAPPAAAPFSLAGNLGASVQSFANTDKGGLLGRLANGVSALATGQRTDPAGVALQLQGQSDNATARALLAKNVDPATVQAAVAAARAGQPDMLKTLITQSFGPDKFQHVTVKNADGSESPQSFDPATGKYSGAAPQAPNKYSVDPSLTGKDRLEALRAVDPLYARKIESMVAGDFPMPTGVAALRPESKRMIEDALAVDGATSASDFATRAATRKDYASGIASRVTKSINTTIGHFATLDQSIDKLGNYTYFPHVANAVHDAYSSNLDPTYQKAKATFEANKEAAVKELDFALSGGHSSVSGSAELRDKFNRADSPGALHAAVTEAMSLLQKRLQSHTKAFNEGTKSQRDAQDFIYPENQQAFGQMLGEPGEGGAAPPAGAPAPGSYVWTPKGGLVGGK